MTATPSPLNLMIAHADRSQWAVLLARSLAMLPLAIHRSCSAETALELAATRRMHLAVVDDDLPVNGGRDVLRSFRRLGLELPCLLVCREPDERVLHEAIQLQVFSVLQADVQQALLAQMILRAAHRYYRCDWALPAQPDGSLN